MGIREEFLEHWKVILTVAVLVTVNVLTFSAQEMSLEHERLTVAGLARQLTESNSREARLVAANEAQSTRISQLESSLRATGKPQGASPTAAGAAARLNPTSAPPTPVPPTPAAPPATATATATTRATPQPTATRNPPTATAATPSPSAASETRYIATPNRRGVFIRLECSAQSATAGVWLEGTRVTVEGTSANCQGWLRVRSDDGQAGWVAAQLLSATQPP
jgi:hypothetical protein